MLKFGVHRSMLCTLLLWNRLFGEGLVQVFDTGSRCAADVLKRPS